MIPRRVTSLAAPLSDDGDWAKRLVDTYKHWARGFSRQQTMGLAFLVCFLILAFMQGRGGDAALATDLSSELHRRRGHGKGVRAHDAAGSGNAARRGGGARSTPPGRAYAVQIVGAVAKSADAAAAAAGSAAAAAGASPEAVSQHATVTVDSQGCFVSFESADTLKGSLRHSEGGGMRLSALQHGADKRLYTCDEDTGVVYEMLPPTQQLFARWVLAAADGQREQPFRCTWLAAKEGSLYAGSLGTEGVDVGAAAAAAESSHSDLMWVKVLDEHGGARARSVLWERGYKKIREALGCPQAGYVAHRAVRWSAVHRQWIFVPYRVSHTPYVAGADDADKAASVVVRCDDVFRRCTAHPFVAGAAAAGSAAAAAAAAAKGSARLGVVDFSFVPDGTDTKMVLLRTRPRAANATAGANPLPPPYESSLMVLSTTGQILMEDIWVPSEHRLLALEISSRG